MPFSNECLEQIIYCFCAKFTREEAHPSPALALQPHCLSAISFVPPSPPNEIISPPPQMKSSSSTPDTYLAAWYVQLMYSYQGLHILLSFNIMYQCQGRILAVYIEYQGYTHGVFEISISSCTRTVLQCSCMQEAWTNW